MQQFAAIFILNLLTSIDNAIVIGGIVQRTRHNLVLVGAVSALILAFLRTALILGVLSVTDIPGFRIGIGLIVLWVALRLSEVIPDPKREPETTFWRVIVMVVATDLALSIDNILSLSVVTKNPIAVGLGVLLSLLPLLLLLPVVINVMKHIWWLQILAAGFVAELAVDLITDDRILGSRMPTGWKEVIIRGCAALIVMFYGWWKMRRKRKEFSSE
ncbi:hypothetical protein LLE49_22965 [Alicyclobacillus tolerans]|uniref:TerC family protein n=1 Tax=Alicyclobacillus tolerans TaxID=90970 RepID=UPI001F217863|nr:hypothetical protein [Alicyclobacillus tolerans]MCF8567586.1 hypothetical protein [Alicyclobacillus tolerans]